ncbi:hypothetical protein FVE85_6817 [Porphyridium purpureum]|uniref:B30.2/SPRY domain-containing protein n=1 Tax=Porphyridium purpureum TaxID=35688 RepID=A0A5J4Z860_PORPP|nr:hypothetical protein FVE85_6817 [Porphyridium purpureum]|eukprot:POR1340..scf295_1
MQTDNGRKHEKSTREAREKQERGTWPVGDWYWPCAPWISSMGGFTLDSDEWTSAGGAEDGCLEVSAQALRESSQQRFNAMHSAALPMTLDSDSAVRCRCDFLHGEKGIAWFGVSAASWFGAGWKCHAVQYGGPGNVTDGGAALRTSYGTGITAGDHVDVVLVCENKSLSIGWLHNGRALGCVLELPADKMLREPLFPLVSFSAPNSDGDVISVKVSPPTSIGMDEAKQLLVRQEPTVDTSRVFGRWELVSPDDSKGLVLTVEGNALSYRVVNIVRYSVEPATDHKAITFSTPHAGMSTMMMGPPEAMEREQRMAALVAACVRAELVDGKLIGKSGSGDVHFESIRAGTEPEPVRITSLRFIE